MTSFIVLTKLTTNVIFFTIKWPQAWIVFVRVNYFVFSYETLIHSKKIKGLKSDLTKV